MSAAAEPELSLAEALEMAHTEGLIALAGDAAARRAVRGSPGWRKVLLSRDAITAAHEAGHVIIAVALGQCCFGASIVQDPSVKLGVGVLGGFALVGKYSEPSSEPPAAPTLTDRQSAAKFASFMDAQPTWKTMLRTIRTWRAEVDGMLDARWPLVSKLVGELERRRVLNQHEIAAILGGGQVMSAAPSTTPAAGHWWAETELLFLLAGKAAERLALRGSEPGWRRFRTADELRSFHEAAHGLIAASRGRTVYSLSIIPDLKREVGTTGLYIVGGYCEQGSSPDPLPEGSQRAPLETDEHRAVRIAAIFAMGSGPRPQLQSEIAQWLKPGWLDTLSVVREYQRRSEALLAANWFLLVKLSAELLKRQVLNQREIAAILGRV